MKATFSTTLDVMPPTLYLLCGLPGAGKTILAKEMERSGQGVVLNADLWVCMLYPEDAEAAARDERKARVQDVQWELAERLLTVGTSVILDHGVSKRAERDFYRDRAEELGAEVQTIFLDVPLEQLRQRVAQRNLDLQPGTFRISSEELDAWAPLFEAPTQEEMARERRSRHDEAGR